MKVIKATVHDAVVTITFDDGDELKMTRWEWVAIQKGSDLIWEAVHDYLSRIDVRPSVGG